jgi:hypothetical protein
MDLTVTMWEGVAECICFRIGTSGGLWWTRQWTFGFHKGEEFVGYLSDCWLLKENLWPFVKGLFWETLNSKKVLCVSAQCIECCI